MISLTTTQRNISKYIYNRQFVFDTAWIQRFRVSKNSLHNLGLVRQSDPVACEAAEFPTSAGRSRERWRWCDRKWKRSCRGGPGAKLKAKPFRLSLPSILLANVRSIENTLDYLKLDLSTKREIRDCCVLIFTETWLNLSIPDVAISLEGLTTLRADRSYALTGKSRGGGVSIYTKNSWCNNVIMIVSHCSTDIEFMIIKGRPFYLPQEFSTLIITAVFIPPSANTKNTLDLVYTNIKKAFRAAPHPHLGSSDHLSVMLIPE